MTAQKARNDMTKTEFISKVAGNVQKYASAYGILVHSPVIAQAILESGWGGSKLSSQYHQLFRIEVWQQMDRKVRKHENAGGVYTRNTHND